MIAVMVARLENAVTVVAVTILKNENCSDLENCTVTECFPSINPILKNNFLENFVF